jgi:hypothetical protein
MAGRPFSDAQESISAAKALSVESSVTAGREPRRGDPAFLTFTGLCSVAGNGDSE